MNLEDMTPDEISAEAKAFISVAVMEDGSKERLKRAYEIIAALLTENERLRAFASEQADDISRITAWHPHSAVGALRFMRLEKQYDAVREVLQVILDQWPYLNCVCGRNKPRISESLRERAKVALEGGRRVP
jgi:hypothetical protein